MDVDILSQKQKAREFVGVVEDVVDLLAKHSVDLTTYRVLRILFGTSIPEEEVRLNIFQSLIRSNSDKIITYLNWTIKVLDLTDEEIANVLEGELELSSESPNILPNQASYRLLMFAIHGNIITPRSIALILSRNIDFYNEIYLEKIIEALDLLDDFQYLAALVKITTGFDNSYTTNLAHHFPILQQLISEFIQRYPNFSTSDTEELYQNLIENFAVDIAFGKDIHPFGYLKGEEFKPSARLLHDLVRKL